MGHLEFALGEVTKLFGHEIVTAFYKKHKIYRLNDVCKALSIKNFERWEKYLNVGDVVILDTALPGEGFKDTAWIKEHVFLFLMFKSSDSEVCKLTYLQIKDVFIHFIHCLIAAEQALINQPGNINGAFDIFMSLIVNHLNYLRIGNSMWDFVNLSKEKDNEHTNN